MIAEYDAVHRRGGGGTLFVAGGSGSGRSTLLRTAAAELERVRPRPQVPAGALVDGSFVAWPREPSRTGRALSVAGDVASVVGQLASLGETFSPTAGLVSEILLRSKAALELARKLLGGRESPEPFELVARLLRELCQQGPVVCIVDDADQADGFWADLALFFGRRFALDLPLLLVLGVDGPSELDARDDGGAPILDVARELIEVDVASWHPLLPIGIDELRSWTGPAAPDVLRLVLEVTDGRAGWAAQLWQDWRERGVIEDLAEGRWRFAAGREPGFNAVDDLLSDRLRRLIGADDVNALANARRLLACAALDGQRFTAAAIARTLDINVDEVIDLLDDKLTASDERPDGVVLKDSLLTVHDERGERHLRLYRFARELDWVTLRHHGHTPSETRNLSRPLAEAIEAQYGGQAWRVAQTLTRLYETAGDQERARHYRRMGDIGVSRSILLWRAHQILTTEPPITAAARRRASHVLIAAAESLANSGPFDDGLAFAQAAERLAPLRRDQAHAFFLRAKYHSRVGSSDQARRELNEVLALYRDLGDRRGAAGVRYELAGIAVNQGQWARARRELTAVLALFRELDHPHGESAVRKDLGHVAIHQGQLATAHRELTAALELDRELGDRYGEAADLQELARLEIKQRTFARARGALADALAIARELRDHHGEAVARLELARVDMKQGQLRDARRELTAIIPLVREIGDRRGEAAVRLELARVLIDQRELVPARRELIRSLALFREVNDPRMEATARAQLAVLDRPVPQPRQGNVDERGSLPHA